jgi:hypothetical protein
LPLPASAVVRPRRSRRARPVNSSQPQPVKVDDGFGASESWPIAKIAASEWRRRRPAGKARGDDGSMIVRSIPIAADMLEARLIHISASRLVLATKDPAAPGQVPMIIY